MTVQINHSPSHSVTVLDKPFSISDSRIKEFHFKTLYRTFFYIRLNSVHENTNSLFRTFSFCFTQFQKNSTQEHAHNRYIYVSYISSLCMQATDGFRISMLPKANLQELFLDFLMKFVAGKYDHIHQCYFKTFVLTY